MDVRYMLLYRSIRPIPQEADLEQVKEVRDFFQCFKGDNPRYKGFYKTYRSEAQFEEILFHDIDTILAKRFIGSEESKEVSPQVIQDILPTRTITSIDQEYHARKLRLQAMLANHRDFINNRLESFVGREEELEEIRYRIAEKLKTGGYITITGQAGQGKSCIIAKLVEEYGPDKVSFHFIPFNPGPDHQVGLLRNLMARLILKYNLPEIYVASESRPALRDYFPKVLGELVEKGGQEVIFVDGLDQLEEELSGFRDLSFLPNNPPSGVVFVLGTRPDDTLKPLELLKPRHEYKLPDLSRDDFDLLLEHRHVTLSRELANRFYEAMQKNALYLDLVAKELTEAGVANEIEVIKRIADNPDNIFSLSIERFRRQERQWRTILKPVLGLLLAAQEPLEVRHIRRILAVEDDEIRDGLRKLGGLVAEDGQGRRYLFHLKLQEYLRQNKSRPDKEFVFASDEEIEWHKKLIQWCEQNGLENIWLDERRDMDEQGSRVYARRHYIAHLYQSKEWEMLWRLLDEGTYGQAKVRFDPSTRAYAQDLDIGRQAAAWEEWSFDEGIRLLPYLWRYTLLRCSLTSRADQYTPEAFEALMFLKRVQQAVDLAELLTNLPYKVEILCQIARSLRQQQEREQEGIQLLMRACEVAKSIEEGGIKTQVLRDLGKELVTAQQWEEAVELVYTIEANEERVNALYDLLESLIEALRWEQAEIIVRLIGDSGFIMVKTKALHKFSRALIKAQQWEQAETVVRLIEKGQAKDDVLHGFSRALIEAQQWEQAETVTRLMGGHLFESTKREAIRELGCALIEMHRWEQAETIVSLIEENQEKDEALYKLSRALIEAHEWIRVEAIVQLIEGEKERIGSLRELVLALINAQQWEQTESIVFLIKGRMFRAIRAEMLHAFVAALIEAQRWEKAESVIYLARESDEKAELLMKLAAALVKARQWELIQGVWTELEAMALETGKREERDENLYKLITHYIMTQQWKRAESIVYLIEGRRERFEALYELARALDEISSWEQTKTIWAEAEAVARTIENSRDKVMVLGKLLVMLRNLQQRERVEALKIEIEATVSKIKGNEKKVRVLIDAKQWEQAEAVLRLIKGYEKDDAIQELAIALIKAQQWEKAEAMILMFEDEEDLEVSYESGTQAFEERWGQAERVVSLAQEHWDIDDGLLRVLSKELIETEQWELAKVMMGLIQVDENREYALLWIALTLFKEGHLDKAKIMISLIDEIKHFQDNDEELYELGTELIKANWWEQAESIINLLWERKWRVGLLYKLVRELIEAQQWERAEAIMSWSAEYEDAEGEEDEKNEKEHRERIEVLYELGVALIKANRWEQAESVASLVEDSKVRASLLYELVRELIKAQQWERAEAIVRWSAEDEEDEEDGEDEEEGEEDGEDEEDEENEEDEEFEGDRERIEVLYELGVALIEEGQWQRAEVIIRLIQKELDIDDRLNELAMESIQEQRWKQAEVAAYLIEKNEGNVKVLCELGIALTKAQQWRKAEDVWSEAQRIAVAIKVASTKVKALCKLGSALNEAHQRGRVDVVWEEAVWVARNIERVKTGAEVLQKLGIALINAQQWERAKVVTYAVEERKARAKMLLRLGIDTNPCSKRPF